VKRVAAAALALLATAASGDDAHDRGRQPTTAEVLESTRSSDWRQPDAASTMYLELDAGRVIIELAPRFAPEHVANIRRLVSERFFDGLTIVRVQDNFVAQWGDPDGTRPTEAARRQLADETTIAWSPELPFVKLPDPDGYARETGWIDGFPAGVERKPSRQAWLAHCYGTLGVGRDDWPDNGSGAELYVVIGQAPRQLDRNIVVVGRVLRGMELLSSLPRGGGPLGFYEKAEQRVPIRSVRMASELPATERAHLEVLRTDTSLFTKYIESRRNRRDDWYLRPAGHVDICNVAIPVRDMRSDPNS
jgi:peptidylprolyl isomerase